MVRPLLKNLHVRPRRERDEELQARIESAVPVEAAGENRSESAADLPGQKRPDAEDTFGVPFTTVSTTAPRLSLL